MKISIIRHEKVDMLWKKKYNSATFDLACDQYDKCPIVLSRTINLETDNAQKVYISEMNRTYETACRLFKKGNFLKTPLLNEVPLRSFRNTTNIYPLWLWNFVGRLQWFLQNDRQAETKKDTVLRANRMIKMLEDRREDCYLITHGFFMRVLIRELKKHGYTAKNSFGMISNLDMIIAEKERFHF